MQKNLYNGFTVILISLLCNHAWCMGTQPFLLHQKYILTFDQTPTIVTSPPDSSEGVLSIRCVGAHLVGKRQKRDTSDCVLDINTRDVDDETVIELSYPVQGYSVAHYTFDSSEGHSTIVIELRNNKTIEQLNRMVTPVLWYS